MKGLLVPVVLGHAHRGTFKPSMNKEKTEPLGEVLGWSEVLNIVQLCFIVDDGASGLLVLCSGEYSARDYRNTTVSICGVWMPWLEGKRVNVECGEVCGCCP